MGLINFMKGVYNKMFNKEIRELANITEIKNANSIYNDRLGCLWAPLFKINDLNLKYDPCNRKIDIYGLVCDKFAMYVSNEITCTANIEEVDEVLQDYMLNLKSNLEYAYGLSGVIAKPYIKNGELVIETITPENYIILNMRRKGVINKIVFLDKIKKGKFYYTKMEIHDLTKYEVINNVNVNVYEIKNICFKAQDSYTLGRQVMLTEVEEWANIEPYAKDYGKSPLFAFFTTARTNKYDCSYYPTTLADGIIDIIIDSDKTYSDLIREYRLKRAKGVIAETAVPPQWWDSEKNIIKKYEDIDDFFVMYQNEDETKDPIKFVDGTIRINEYEQGLNFILRQCENKMNLPKGTLSEMLEGVKTATEIVASSQDTINAIKSEQKQVELFLIQLQEAIKSISDIYNINAYANLKFEITIGDGVLVDKEKLKQDGLLLKNSGAISQKTFLMEYMGYDEEKANAEIELIKAEQPNMTYDLNFE